MKDAPLDWVSQQLQNTAFRVEYDKERAAYEFSAQLQSALARQGKSRADLARELGCSRASVSQKLRKQNLTIRTMAEFAAACGHELHIALHPVPRTQRAIYET